MKLIRRFRRCGTSFTPAPAASSTSSTTHNGVTPANATATVSTRAALLSNLNTLPAGSTIVLAGPAGGGPANYAAGGFSPASRTVSPAIIVRAADYNDKPLFEVTPGVNSIDLTGFNGLDMRGCEFSFRDTGYSTFAVVLGQGAFNNLSLRQCYFHGDVQSLTVAQSAGNSIWLDAIASNNILIEYCVTNRVGILIRPRNNLVSGATGCNGVTLQYNSFLRTYNHIADLQKCSNFSFNHNLADGFHPGYISGNYDSHADVVLQVLTDPETASGFIYTDNFAIELRDFYRYSMQVENDSTTPNSAQGYTIERNVHIGGVQNPMNLANMTGTNTIKDNQLYYVTGSAEVTQARIRLLNVTATLSGNTAYIADMGGNTVSPQAVGGVDTGIDPLAATTLRNAFALANVLNTQSTSGA